MLSRRLIAVPAAVAAIGVLGACDQPIKDNLVVPGITAMDEARVETCGINASTLRTAIEIYEIRTGGPPPDEAALVPDYIREETTDWDIVDGALVAENPACGPVGDAAPTPTQVDIVTESGPRAAPDDVEARTADEYLAELSPDEIDALGGSECAAELAAILASVDRYLVDVGQVPASFEEIVAAGLLDPPERWEITAGELVPVADSGCIHPDDALTQP